jgi:hypothetical protein
MELALYRALLQRWKQGQGSYPYPVPSPRMHRALSVALGSFYAFGVFGQARLGLTHMVVEDPRCLIGASKEPAIFVCWHRWASVAIEFAWWLRVHGGLQGRQVWLNLLSPHMGPTHVLLEWAGVEMAFTGTPEMSRLSANGIADALRARTVCATVVMPDGPDGPRRKFRRGALHMALRSGVPIVPLHISGHGHYCTNTWDQKRIQVPGSKVQISLGTPMYIHDASHFDACQQVLVSQMD